MDSNEKVACKIRNFILLPILLAFAPPCSNHCTAATYYISSSDGNDSNNGLSSGSPWKSLDTIYLKQTFGPGDQILLRKGDAWEGQIRINAGGTAASPVLLSSYGSGPNPVIYGDSHTAKWIAVSAHAGLFTARVGYGSTFAQAYEGTTALTYLNVNTSCGGKGCNLSNPMDLNTYMSAFTPGSWGYSNSTLWVMTLDGMPPTTVRIFRSATIAVENSQYLTIQGLDLRQSNTGIDIAGSSNVTIQENSLQDLLGIGIYLRGTGGSDVNNLIENNTLTRTGNDALYVLEGTDNTFTGNTISHVTNQILGISVGGDGCGIGLQQSTNTIVEHNSISSVRGSCFDYFYETGSAVRYNYCLQPGTGGAAPHGTGLSVYYNIFDLAGHGSGINAVNTGSSPNLIYNNTIYETAGTALMGGDSVSDGGTGPVIFRNNIVQGSSWYLMARGSTNESGMNVTSDYNLFYTTGRQLFSNLGINYTSFKEYQDASGQEAHSIFLAPQFVLANPTVAADFRLEPTSPGTRAGENLQSAGFVGLAEQYVDYDGNPISTASQPNVGAFQ